MQLPTVRIEVHSPPMRPIPFGLIDPFCRLFIAGRYIAGRYIAGPFIAGPLIACLLLAGCSDEPPRRRPPPEPSRMLVAQLYASGEPVQLDLAGVEALVGQDLRPGLQAQIVRDSDGTLLVVTARLDLVEPGLRGVTVRNPEGAIPEDMLRDDALALLIGSGFVSELMALSPLGLLQIDGEVVSRIQRHGYTRVLGIGDNRLGVVGHLQYERGLFHSALQAGPGVIEAGNLDISPRDLERQPFFRSEPVPTARSSWPRCRRCTCIPSARRCSPWQRRRGLCVMKS